MFLCLTVTSIHLHILFRMYDNVHVLRWKPKKSFFSLRKYFYCGFPKKGTIYSSPLIYIFYATNRKIIPLFIKI